jgi:hypothetical protein
MKQSTPDKPGNGMRILAFSIGLVLFLLGVVILFSANGLQFGALVLGGTMAAIGGSFLAGGVVLTGVLAATVPSSVPVHPTTQRTFDPGPGLITRPPHPPSDDA